MDEQNHNPQPQTEHVDTQQVDADGTDLLFDFAQKLQQREQRKQPKPQEEAKEKAPKQVEQPNMVEERPPQEAPAEQDALADEYMHDAEAQQLEGKLATEQTAQQAHQEEDADMDPPVPEEDQHPQTDGHSDVEMTQQQAQKDVKQSQQQLRTEGEPEEQEPQQREEAGATEQDLIQMYNDYLHEQQQLDA